MNNLLRSLSFLAIGFLISTSVPVFGKDKKARRVSIETIEDLKLSGYNQDDEGELQWRLEADSADADPQTKSEDIKRTRWNLRNLRLLTFGKKGEVFAKMTSPDGQFNPEKREADSDSAVEVRGANFTVRGAGWSWAGKGHDNLIRVHSNVFVSLPQEDLTVRAKRLTIKGEDEKTELMFSGGVEVAYKDIFMMCETLEIEVSGSGNRARELDGEKGADGWRSAVSRISGRGNVSIKRESTSLEGDSAEFLPQENLFRVRGNARLEDASAQISVRGDEATGEIEKNFIEVVAKRPNAALPGAPTAVSVEMPSIVDRRKAGTEVAGAASEFRSVVSGKRMTVSLAKAENVISLFESVRVSDREITIDADKLVVTTDPSDPSSLLEVQDSRSDSLSVRSAIAEGNVRANYSGRILNCARADVFPQKKRITLTGTPTVVSEEENASLSGARVEVFLDRDVIEVSSEETDAPNRKRVEVELPGFSEVASSSQKKGVPAATEKTKVLGDHLTLTRGDRLSTFDIFGNVVLASADLEGTCGRIIVFADSEALGQNRKNTPAKKSGLSQIRKIIADGNVELRQNGYEFTGGRATITPAVELKEWVAEDRNAADGEMPCWVVVEPDANTGTRPRLTFPGDAAGTQLSFALPAKSDDKKREKNVPKKTVSSMDLPLSKKKVAEKPAAPVPAKKSYLESDAMELIAGKARARFFLRGDVILATEGGAHGMCDHVEGLLMPGAETKRFEAKKVVCRGNVRLVHDGTEGKGATLEIFPPQNRAVLSGDARIRDKSGIALHPGNDRFVFDLESRQLITGADAEAGGKAVPAQVSRPRIVIPKGADRVFIIPKSVRGNTNEKE